MHGERSQTVPAGQDREAARRVMPAKQDKEKNKVIQGFLYE
jgi:hypothetical protein